MATALTTKARIKERLQITAESFDDLFDRLILSVSARIERMCGRVFLQATFTNELHDGLDPAYGTRRHQLIIRNAPVLAITSVEYKAGSNSDPRWTAFDEDDYEADLAAGILYFRWLPSGRRNVRITYQGGYSGYSIGVTTYWVFNSTPTGTVNGTNRVFTLPEAASQVVVYADGIRIKPVNYAFTADTDEITFAEGYQPFSAISVDYLPTGSAVDEDDPTLPLELVEVCEEAVIRLFKRRDAEGRSSETLGESTVTYTDNIFTKENLATIKNYRRGYSL